jgi:hypothetical protein
VLLICSEPYRICGKTPFFYFAVHYILPTPEFFTYSTWAWEVHTIVHEYTAHCRSVSPSYDYLNHIYPNHGTDSGQWRPASRGRDTNDMTGGARQLPQRKERTPSEGFHNRPCSSKLPATLSTWGKKRGSVSDRTGDPWRTNPVMASCPGQWMAGLPDAVGFARILPRECMPTTREQLTPREPTGQPPATSSGDLRTAVETRCNDWHTPATSSYKWHQASALIPLKLLIVNSDDTPRESTNSEFTETELIPLSENTTCRSHAES